MTKLFQNWEQRKMIYQWEKCPFAGEMEPSYLDRQIPGEPTVDPHGKVLALPFVSSWRERVWSLIDDLVTQSVVSAISEDPPEYFVSDDLSWLNEVISAIENIDVDMKEVLADRLFEEYSSVRAFHGTRTAKLNSFYENGLRYLRSDEIEDVGRRLFVNDQSKEDLLQDAIADCNVRNPLVKHDGALYFCASIENLLCTTIGSGHYLVYGSEYLYSLGVRIWSHSETQRILKGIGRPTLFSCDVPLKLLSPGTLGEFAGMMLEHLFTELQEGKANDELPEGTQIGFCIHQDLPAKHIVGHWHPKAIRDPMARLA